MALSLVQTLLHDKRIVTSLRWSRILYTNSTGSVWSDEVIFFDIDAVFFEMCVLWNSQLLLYVFVRLCALSHKISCDDEMFSPCTEIQRCDENGEIWRLHWSNYILSLFFYFMRSNELHGCWFFFSLLQLWIQFIFFTV
jgi:hypothetical protein